MTNYSEQFSFFELTNSADHRDLVAQNRIDAMQFQNAGKRLSKLLETIRHILGDHPIKISSGFRNKALNIAVGSKAKNSAHQRFEAADIIHSTLNIKEAFTSLIEAYNNGLIPDMRKLIREDHKGILHIEVKMKSDEETHFYTTNNNVDFKVV